MFDKKKSTRRGHKYTHNNSLFDVHLIIRVLCLLIFVFVLMGSTQIERSVYEKLNSIYLEKNVYENLLFGNDSTYLDTLNVSVQKEGYLIVLEDIKKGKIKSKYFYFEEPYKLAKDNDSIFKSTSLYYDLIGDSINYFFIKEEPLGEAKYFEVNGKSIRVLKQPFCTFCKYEFNLVRFYTDEYGVILSLTKHYKRKLKYIQDEEITPELKALIKVVEMDENFFSMDM